MILSISLLIGNRTLFYFSNQIWNWVNVTASATLILATLWFVPIISSIPNASFIPILALVIAATANLLICALVSLLGSERVHAIHSKITNTNGKCCVCNLKIEQSEEISACPHCSSLAHRSHWLEWIKIKEICPHCKSSPKENRISFSN